MKRKLIVDDFVSAYKVYIETVFNRRIDIDEKSTETGLKYLKQLQEGEFPVH